MSYIYKNFNLFLENNNSKKSNIDLIKEICVSMLLINPNFLDNILDKGIRARYTTNNSVFLNDLKNLVLGKNRMKLGKWSEGKYIENGNLGKINNYFNEYTEQFDMESDWNKLHEAREIARNITDKLLYDEKLRPEMIKNIFWLSPINTDNKVKEDIVIELHNGVQYPVVINKKLSLNKTKSFNTLMDTLIGEKNIDKLYNDFYLKSWNRLIKNWVKLIYDNSKPEYQDFINKFINISNLDKLNYFIYFNLKHSNNKFQHLGEYFKPLNDNYLELSKLMSDIYKNGDDAFKNPEEVYSKWKEIKKVILNSEIIEHLLTTSFSKLIEGEVERTDDNYIIANNKIKLKFLKVLVDILDIRMYDLYYSEKNNFYYIPSEKWMTENFDDIKVVYDYHAELTTDDENQMDVKISYKDKEIFNINMSTKFTGGEMSNKLSTKIKVEIPPYFHYYLKNKE